MTTTPDSLSAGSWAARVDVQFVDCPVAPAFELAARAQGERLRRRVPGVRGCSITLRALQQQDALRRYSVTVDAHLPGDEFTTCRLDSRDAQVALARAFEGLFLQISEQPSAGSC